MAVIIDDKPLFFIHIPKTAGTSVSFWLYENFKAYRWNKHCMGKEIPKNLIENKKSFTVVRHPYNRIHSWYYYHLKKLQRTKNKGRLTADNPWIHYKDIGFASWVENFFIERKNGCIDKTQESYLLEDTIVLKQESLDTDFKIIQEEFQCFKSLPRRNVTESKPNMVQDYSKKAKKIIQDIYHNDFITFKYNF